MNFKYINFIYSRNNNFSKSNGEFLTTSNFFKVSILNLVPRGGYNLNIGFKLSFLPFIFFRSFNSAIIREQNSSCKILDLQELPAKSICKGDVILSWYCFATRKYVLKKLSIPSLIWLRIISCNSSRFTRKLTVFSSPFTENNLIVIVSSLYLAS